MSACTSSRSSPSTVLTVAGVIAVTSRGGNTSSKAVFSVYVDLSVKRVSS